jgi:carbamoyl-phosphate synthase/aspartate carbamoyltransferase
LRDLVYQTVMVSYSPVTVSTDYDEADRLYCESISLETILNIALPLCQNVRIYGTSSEMIDTAENRFKFSRLLDQIGVDQPQWKELTSLRAFCDSGGLSRLGSTLVRALWCRHERCVYAFSRKPPPSPVIILSLLPSTSSKPRKSKWMRSQGRRDDHALHLGNAGGDATLIHPPQDLDHQPETVRQIEEATAKIGNARNITGLFNIQFIAEINEIKAIECNLQAALSYPKSLGYIDAIEIATKVMLDFPVEPYPVGAQSPKI